MRVVEFAEVRNLVGQEVGASEWLLIDQDRINKFAEATGDHQWIHVDPARAAKELPTGKTIAHGFLTLSLLPVLMGEIMKINGVSRGINYGSNRVRFTNMVPVGSRVRARQTVKAVDEVKGGGQQITNEVTVEIEGQDRPALVAESITVVYP
ncbi:MaoC family dehydratase [Zavarzinia sp. CC-PAN008]|uniref:MaoC family dehydratase n=1 Tax=Zavarzinia sp. CC-PAN008 TaxID=3243332 RepID=UPI003F74622D